MTNSISIALKEAIALQEALEKSVQAWDKDTPEAKAVEAPSKGPQLFQPTSNATRVTFNTIRDNPGRHRRVITQSIVKQGYTVKSISSLITQMLRQGMVIERNGCLFATIPEYTPIKSYKTMHKKAAPAPAPAPKQKQPQKTSGIAALAEPVAPAPAPVQINSAWDADTILEHLSIKQARALYNELRDIFGDK